jgi:hypothetical protein
MMMGSEPSDCLAVGEEFDAFRDYLTSYGSLDQQSQERILAQLGSDLASFLRDASNNPAELFWLELVSTKQLEADVSESLFDTTYISLFVNDAEEARLFLSEKVRLIMAKAPICT